MSATTMIGNLSIREVKLEVCNSVKEVRKRIKKKICSYFNNIPLTLPQVKKYCDWNREVELWFRPLPLRTPGLLIFEKNTFIIVCNDKMKDERVQCKIILHELGHYLLHRSFFEKTKHAHSDTNWFTDEIEKQAVLFSLVGMVPDHEVGKVVESHEDLEDQLQVLMNQYAFTRDEAIVRIAAFRAEETDIKWGDNYQQNYVNYLEACRNLR